MLYNLYIDYIDYIDVIPLKFRSQNDFEPFKLNTAYLLLLSLFSGLILFLQPNNQRRTTTLNPCNLLCPQLLSRCAEALFGIGFGLEKASS